MGKELTAKDVTTPIDYRLYDGYFDAKGERLSTYNDRSGESYHVSLGDLVNIKHKESADLIVLLRESLDAFVGIARDQNYQAQSMAKDIQKRVLEISGVDMKINW